MMQNSYQFLNQVIQLVLSGLVPIVVAWIMWEIKRLVGASVSASLESKASADLNTALGNGVAIAMQKLQAWETLHEDPEIKNQVLRLAADYAASHAPDAVASFGLGPEALAQKALAFVPQPPPVAPPAMK